METAANRPQPGAGPLGLPDIIVSARDLFRIETDLQVPAYSSVDEHVPPLDPDYVFDRDTTLALLAGFTHNRRVMVQGLAPARKPAGAEGMSAPAPVAPFRVGHGYDIHRLQDGGRLVLGGVVVSEQMSAIAHSDGDVVIHAIVDALLDESAQAVVDFALIAADFRAGVT